MWFEGLDWMVEWLFEVVGLNELGCLLFGSVVCIGRMNEVGVCVFVDVL